MRKKAIFFIGILLLCGAGWGFYLYHKPHEGVKGLRPDVVIKADDLYKQYSENEADANHKFLNRIIAVTGVIAGMHKENSAYIIQLKGDDAGGISCNLFDKMRNDLQLKQGETTTIKGRCTGFLMDVALTDCIIEEP